MHSDKLLSRADLLSRRAAWRQAGQRLVLTNGCFDVLHRGHVEYLQEARALGDILVVGLNTDDSVSQLKGDPPLNQELDRAALLCALQDVDIVTLFCEPSVEPLVQALCPDVLVKGGDYRLEQVVGRQFVLDAGGQVRVLRHVAGHSSTRLRRQIL